MATESIAAPRFEPGRRMPLPPPHESVTLRVEYADTASDATLDAILELLRRAFNGGPSWFALPVDRRDHLRWKATNRAARSSFQLLEDGERLVGFYVGVWDRVLLFDRATTNATGYDYAIDPEYQNRRLGSAWTARANEVDMDAEAGLTLGYAMHPTSSLRRNAAPEGTSLFGNQLQTLVRPLGVRRLLEARGTRSRVGAQGSGRTRAVLERQARRLPAWVKPEYPALARSLVSQLLPRRARPAAPGLRISTTRSLDERIDGFWTKVAGAFDLIQIRDREYLEWRYLDPRGGPRTFRLAAIGDEVAGYGVLRRAGAATVIDDLLVLPGRTDIAHALVADAISQAEVDGAAYLRTTMPRHHPYRGALGAHAFSAYPNAMIFNYRPRALPAAAVAPLSDRHARIHVTIADSDHW